MDKKSKRRKRAAPSTPTKEEKREMDMVAKYLKKNLKCKEVTLKGEKLEIFTGVKAVDQLMESEWGGASRRSASGEKALAFPSRVSAASYCERLLSHGYFLRGLRIEAASSASKDNKSDQPDASPRASAVLRKKAKKEASSDGGAAEKKSDKSEKSTEKKAKKKFKIGFHEREDQFFEDSVAEIYIWQYNPSSWRTTFIGFGLLSVVIAFTMYPLWPDWSRVGAYYVSIGLASLLGLLLLAEVFRVIIFSGIWLSTWGRVHFMILPNLYEDVGFWESFKPTYTLEYKGDDDDEDDDDDDEDGEALEGRKTADDSQEDDRATERSGSDGECDDDALAERSNGSGSGSGSAPAGEEQTPEGVS